MPNRKAFPGIYLSMVLTQLIDGWAIYNQYEVNTQGTILDFLVAVRRNSLRGKLRQGERLVTHASCLGRLKDTTAKNLRGFPMRVRRYEAIYP